MQVRPYILYGQTALENMEISARRLLQDWADDWGMSGVSLSAVQPVIGFGEGGSPESVLAYKIDDGKWALFIQDKELFEDMGSLLLHDNRVRPRQGLLKDSVVTDIIMQALAELACRLSGSDVSDRSSPVESTLRQHVSPLTNLSGSGIVYLEVRISDSTMRLWISAQLAQALASADAVAVDQDNGLDSLIPAGEALGGQTVPVQVTLGNAELTVDALCSLQVGDVIRLDESLNEPARVAFAQSETACKGFLGQKNGNLAVQLDSLVEI
jgi:flagellar motor switch/type III secretory pathway protein FliN